MNDKKLIDSDATEIAKSIHRGDLRSVDLLEFSLKQTKNLQKTTNAFIIYGENELLEKAEALDEQAKQGFFAGPLHGIPVAVKDNYWTADFPTTAGSKVHPPNIKGLEATAVEKLKAAGAIIFGKTNMHEWAYGATNQISAYGPTRNPLNLDHITGGSSGGSGAAVCAGMTPVALGSDTGGSIRIPSSCCGIYGLKPTYGAISRYGVLPLSWSLDVAGPMARSIRDLKNLFSIMAGPDSKDGTTIKIQKSSNEREKPLFKIARLNSEKLKIAKDVEQATEETAKSLIHSGSTVEEVRMENLDVGFGVWKTILFAEAVAYHADFLESDVDLYSEDVRVQLEAGRCISAKDYLRAQQFRAWFNDQWAMSFYDYDAVLLPTIPITAPRLDESHVMIHGDLVRSQDAMTSLAWIANLTGLPAVSFPRGTGENGLPIGMTLIGKPGRDFSLLNIAESISSPIQ